MNMSGLPDGWESDYDGRRWFYKYRPTGLIQYHFPKEGDEFPDFVDTFSPVLDLAPEERLESQQQVRRQASTTTPMRPSPKKNDGGYGMSATARPVSMTWDGTFGEEENTVFQPENFMYLGPGTYNDVSPLAEEEEEAARRVVAGGIEGRVDKSPSKGVSPMGSERTTPAQGTAQAGPITGDPVMVPSTVPEEAIHEMPVLEPQAPDPVGIIAEMPTYDTAQAHIETHPPPIEMADNRVLAPIETAVSMMAELPERTSPVERKNDEPQIAPGSLRNYGGQMQPLRPAKETVEDTPAAFQASKPRNTGNAADIPPNPGLPRRATFQPGETFANASPIRPPDRGHAGTPNVLSPPQVPPKRPLNEPSQPQIPPKHMLDHPSQSNAPLGSVNNGSLAPVQQGDLSHMPSVLKPARGKVPSQSGQQPQSPVVGPGGAQGHGYVPPSQGKHPPSMTPAPQVQQQRLQEPRMGIQRINTVPDSLPSQRPQSTVQTGHQGLPLSTMIQQHPPKRPASVMPDMMGGQTQGTNLPYRSPIESIPPTGLPRSATAGPTTQVLPYPIDNPPYPDDRPVRRREAPYPEEPFVQKPMPTPGPGPTPDPSSPGANNRRHSSFSSALVSPDSRHGSMSFPAQTPSPMEQSRRASTNSSANPNYTPSPVSQSSASMYGFSPTPPSVPANQYQQGSYFTMQDVEGQGHNIAARDVLRKKSLSRGTDARRSSVGSDSGNAQRGSPAPQTALGYNQGTQGLSRSKSLRQISQSNNAPENQPSIAPTPPPQGQQGLGRIEEYDEVPSATVSRSSTMSVSPEMKKSSVSSSVQPSPATSRRASWQVESPKSAASGQFQGQMPQGYAGQPLPHGQAAPAQAQNLKQLQRKPSLGKAPQAPSQQVPTRDPRVPQGMSLQQGPGLQRQPFQSQILPPPISQGQAPRPGQISVQTQKTPHGPAPAGQDPGPTKLQKRSTYGPGTPTGQPPQGQFPQGPIHPGQMPGQMPPSGQQHPLQMNHPGLGPNGRIQPQVQIPQNQQPWPPGTQPAMAKGSRPVSMQPQTSQSAGAKEGKEGKKWLKWLKGGSKSVSHSPTTPVISSPISPAVGHPSWGGGEYSQPAVWQPGQPVSAVPQPGFQGNMPPQSVQMPSLAGQMALQAGQPLPQSGQVPQPGQMQPQQRQMPPQRGQLPPQPGQMQSQSSHMAPRAGQAPPPTQPSARQAQHEPQSHQGGTVPMAGPLTAAPVTKSAVATGLSMAAPPRTEPSSNISHKQPSAPKQPSPVEPAYAPRSSEQIPIPQTKAPEPPQPTRAFASNSLQPRPDTLMSVSPPPPAVSPGLSDAAESSISRMSSQRRDSFSDAGSITTIEVAQAQPQPVLKPSIVQVHRRSTDMWRKSQEVQRNNDSQSSSDVTPRISSETARIGLEPSVPISTFQQKQPVVRSEPTPQVDVPKQNTTIASLTSKFVQPSARVQQANKEQPAPIVPENNSPAYTKPDVPSQHRNGPIPGVSQPPATKAAAPAAEDKWAKKPVVDYSGGDWGDDDDWDY
ncbi:hypothetical protein FSARC_5068 [Fusarium sarcochroum]|uniref:General RNA polymerase II transcription factor TAF12 n=1 Tax=Fusarium sarcochroum TaxID=1208366 RepID=A0A8H4U0R6_9HYPO|nr:hypothetical protein FSARC_5068 [Fusarium sarcochroum]